MHGPQHGGMPTHSACAMSPIQLPHGPQAALLPQQNLGPLHLPRAHTLRLSWARDASEVREAQALRHAVFAEELGAVLRTPPGTAPGLDVDLYDAHCEHLLVRAVPDGDDSGPVVATYRVLMPAAARRVGGLYAEQRFDLTRLRAHRSQLAELGRACVHRDHRNGTAMLMMWGELTAHMQRNGVGLMLGSASLCARDGGAQAWALWHKLAPTHLAPVEWQVRSRAPLPQPLRPLQAEVSTPALLRGYLRANAQLLGEPAWDGDFQCADLPLLLRIDHLPSSYRRHFLPGARLAA